MYGGLLYMNELEIAINNIETNSNLSFICIRASGPCAKKEYKIIAEAPKEEIIKTIIKLERYDLLLHFDKGFDSIKNQEDKIKLIKKIKKVPENWKSDINLLDYFLQQKDYYIVIQFELNDVLKKDLKFEILNILLLLYQDY